MNASSLLYGTRRIGGPGTRRWRLGYSQTLFQLESQLIKTWSSQVNITSAPIDLSRAREQLLVLSPRQGKNTISLRLSSSADERVLIIGCPQHNRDASARLASEISLSLEHRLSEWGIDRLRTIMQGEVALEQMKYIEIKLDDISGNNPYSAKKQLSLLLADAKQKEIINSEQFLALLRADYQDPLAELSDSSLGREIITNRLLSVSCKIH